MDPVTLSGRALATTAGAPDSMSETIVQIEREAVAAYLLSEDFQGALEAAIRASWTAPTKARATTPQGSRR